METLPKKNNYRFELDGIRSIAIVAVFIYHLFPDKLPGGFLGVDIFFTLSGFVITYSISQKVFEGRKKFILDFYERRFKRLTPTLIIYVIAISIMISFFIESGGYYYLTGIFSLFGFANFYLLKINSGYWGDDSLVNPFTNTWSLSVEEQFYFIFPLIIIFSLKKNLENKIEFKMKYFYLISITSFIIYIILYRNFSSFSYYSIITRLWQISLGVVCFKFSKTHFLNNIVNHKTKYFFSLSSLLILISLFFINKDYIFIGHIFASIFTFILILTTQNKNLIKRFLSNKLFTYISKLSYQIYLWHWGLIVIGEWTFKSSLNNYIYYPVVIFLTILISIVVNKLVEEPFRKTKLKLSLFKNLLIIFFTSLIPISLAKPLRNKFYFGQLKGSETLLNNYDDQKLIIHGDSHAEDIFKIIRRQYSGAIKNNSLVGCRYFYTNTEIPLDFRNGCKELEKKNIELKKYLQKKSNIIILASNLNYQINELSNPITKNDNLKEIELLEKFIVELIEDSKASVIFKMPHTSVNSPSLAKPIRCIKRVYRPFLNKDCFVKGVKRIDYNPDYFEYKNRFLKLKDRFSNFYIWEITKDICPDKLCYPTKDDKQFLHDESHLFHTSPFLNDLIIKSLNKIISTI